MKPACDISAVDSLSCSVLRYADRPEGLKGAADGQGELCGGHVMRGCTVRTAAAVVPA